MSQSWSPWSGFAWASRLGLQSQVRRTSSVARLCGGKQPFLCRHRTAGGYYCTKRTYSISDRVIAPQELHSSPKLINKRELKHAAPEKIDASLHRAGAAAQRTSRKLIRGTGRRAHIDPGIATKEVTAYCAADKYDLYVAQKVLVRDGYVADAHTNGLFPQVLHVQTPPPSGEYRISSESDRDSGDIFVFPSGSVVTWNVSETVATTILYQILPGAAEMSHLDSIEVEDLRYIEDSDQEMSRIIGDTIVLGRMNPLATDTPTVEAAGASDGQDGNCKGHEIGNILAKVALSSGLARSAKLAVLEKSLDLYFESTKAIVSTLSSGRKLHFTRAFLLRKTGQLLSIRAQLNLYSELTDSIPDLFWDSPHELGLEDYYESVGRALDINVRIKALNDRMDYAREIAEVLRERLSEKHSTGLEWLIIGLISIEVAFGILNLWNERSDRLDPRSTKALLTAWLEKELRDTKVVNNLSNDSRGNRDAEM